MSKTNRENATCQLLLKNSSTSIDEYSAGPLDVVVFNSYRSSNQQCEPNFDRSLCWYNVSLGELGQRSCPFTFCRSVPGCELVPEMYRVTRQCNENGSWGDSVYGECIDLLKKNQKCVVGYCRTCPDPLRDTVINVSLALSIISVFVLLSALILFSIFKSIQCRRLSIHKNLAAAFVFRFGILAIWTIANTNNLFKDCNHFVPTPQRNLEWLCKLILWLVIYFQVSSVMWMLIEGLYLYSRFTVFAMRQRQVPYSLMLFAGWGVPFVIVMAWTVVHHKQSAANSGSFCWLPYAQGVHLWILAGTMGFILILNVVLLLLIILILVRKLKQEAAESKKIWRTVKATMLLVPLLGASNIPLFYEPTKPGAIYMLGSAILQHSQGIFIAVLYCFLNSEIQNAVKRQLSKVHTLNGFLINQRRRSRGFETEKTYVPLVASGDDHARAKEEVEMETFGKNAKENGMAHHLQPSTHHYSSMNEK